MDNGATSNCNLCGLHRLCLPGRVAGLSIRRAKIDRGSPLFRYGERVDGLFMIRSGCIKEVEDGASRHGTVVNFAMAGEMLSLQSLGCTTSKTTAIAVEPSFVCIVPWNKFNESFAMSPQAVVEFIQLIAQAGVTARESLALIRDKEAFQRVAGFLLNIFSRTQIRGMGAREFRLGMNRDDIANYLGIRSETVSRCFTELSRRQLIKVKAKRVQLLETSELQKIYAGA